MEQCPDAVFPEFAFTGRSNVGKSSLINMLTGRKTIAQVSVTPGKTKLINHFLINNEWFLVDLPGYGFAHRSKKIRANWEIMINNYLTNRRNLRCIFLLADSRIEPQKSDIEFADWLSERALPFVILLTKCDKLSGNELSASIRHFEKIFGSENWEIPPLIIPTSSRNSLGRDEVLRIIETQNRK